MKKLKTYKQHINESIEIKDHEIDLDKVEELLANSDDKKVLEIAPVDIREWTKFSEQLQLINELAESVQTEKLVVDEVMKELALSDDSDIIFSTNLTCRNYVLKKLNHEYKHSIFELIDGYHGLKDETKRDLKSIGFYRTHLYEEISTINEKFQALAKTIKTNILVLTNIDSYIETAKIIQELYKRFVKDGETHKLISEDVYKMLLHIEPRLNTEDPKWFNNAAKRFYNGLTSSEKDLAPVLDLEVRKKGISPAMLSEYAYELRYKIASIAESNRENKRTTGFEDFFRVKPGYDQKSVMRAPEMKAFLKSGKTKLYIDALDAKGGADFPQFPSDVANKITEIYLTINNNTGPNIVNMFALKTSEHPIKVSGGAFRIVPATKGDYQNIDGKLVHVSKLNSKPIPFINAGECNIEPYKYYNEWLEQSLVGNSGEFVIDYTSYLANLDAIKELFKILKDKAGYEDKELEAKAIEYHVQKEEKQRLENERIQREREERQREREERQRENG